MNVEIDPLAQEIIANAKAAIAAAQIGGANVFDNVLDVDDAKTFIRISDPLAGPKKADAGIVNAQPTEDPGTVDTEIVHLIECSVIVRFVSDRGPGQDEATIRENARQYASIVRAA